MAETYWNILSAARDLLVALPSFVPVYVGGTAKRQWRFSLRDAPRWEELLDAVYGVQISPREDLAELIQTECWQNKAQIGYEVYIGIIVPQDKTEETLRERLLLREDIRLAMYKPNLLGSVVSGQWQVEYDQAPNVSQGVPKQLKATWQKFTFLVDQERASDGGVIV